MNNIDKNIINIWENKIKSLGYSAASSLMSSLYPKEFECYMISFELCNYAGETIDFFSFPVLPTEINIQEQFPVNIKNTFGGVSVLSTDIYNPKTITISGNFGRNFKLLNRGDLKFFKAIEWERRYNEQSDQYTYKELSTTVKTGFGCLKVLESILNRSYAVDYDYGMSNKLYFYNLAYGESYLVKAISWTPSQDLSSNAIWKYNLVLQTICPIYLDKQGSKKVKKVYLSNRVQTKMNTLFTGVESTINAIL